jgi:hypothetical protein
MLRRLIYISQSLIGADTDGIEAIVASSTARNTKSGLTGMLWTDSQDFAQVIEGEPSRIGLTMQRIRRDPRHTNIAVLLDRAVLSRQFGSWAMRRARGDEESAQGTAFMIGFAMGEGTASAQRLYEIILGSDRQVYR